MIFTLEALEAKHGDSLLLHYGEAADPRLVLIDGGPKGVYKKSLKPRLGQIVQALHPGDPLEIRLMMVSHIDDDHIQGIIELASAIEKGGDDAPFDVVTLWHNAFDDIAGNVAAIGGSSPASVASIAAMTGAAPPGVDFPPDAAAVVANVSQGRKLRDLAAAMSWNVNWGFSKLVQAPKDGVAEKDLGDGLTFKVIGPAQTRLDALHTDWDSKIAEWRTAHGHGTTVQPAAADLQAIVAEFVDDSVYNLSSIVVLAEAKVGGKARSMLLTGDARGDYIVEEMEKAKLLKSGRLHVDILKMPHHGSSRNIRPSFLKSITADHYVFSANGRDDNPDVETLEQLVEARKKDEYVIHLTNPVPHAVKTLKDAAPGHKFKLDVREDPALSLKVDLGEAVTF